MSIYKLFDIQRNSFVDGPGIRTTVFFRGCNLKCKWCHNPESQSGKKCIFHYSDKCGKCGRCTKSCSENAIVLGKSITKNVCFAENANCCAQIPLLKFAAKIMMKMSCFQY